MTARLIALYQRAPDPEAFEARYRAVHVPIALGLPGLRSYEIGRVARVPQDSDIGFVATVAFDSLDDLDAAFAGPVGDALDADSAAHLTTAVSLYVFDGEELAASTSTPAPTPAPNDEQERHTT